MTDSVTEAAAAEERIARRCPCCANQRIAASPAIVMPFVAKRAFGWEPVEVTAEWGLRDIKAGMAYALCNSMLCAQCGLLFLDIRFNDQEMSALYSGYRGPEYNRLRDRYEPGYIERDAIIQQGAKNTAAVEKFLEAHVPAKPRVLDWGGDTGINSPFKASNAGLDIFDISNKPTIEGARRVDAAEIEGTAYDLIVLSHVLEHVPWPARTLTDIKAVMRDDTVLYIETPYEDLMRLNPGAQDLHTKKKYWHEHINFFTGDSLRALLEGSGMQVNEMQVLETDGGGKHWHVFAIACTLRRDGQ